MCVSAFEITVTELVVNLTSFVLGVQHLHVWVTPGLISKHSATKPNTLLAKTLLDDNTKYRVQNTNYDFICENVIV